MSADFDAALGEFKHEGDATLRADVLVKGETHWASNALWFDTREHALGYAHDLAGRWIAVDKWRAVGVNTPERMRYIPGTEDGSWSVTTPGSGRQP